ncbi:hypothetical protein D1614_22140 [Maribellus luteus]|uniref:Uncharacterized protein n=1 Tax=Maribellus luteus TaxID=2305463 RepID=A0A399SRP9_9BACT|nr:hypothetical protein [Maribellus luteus]RIJ45594.1 hypothetical protein D1614_22140 [Maribellus luteus]
MKFIITILIFLLAFNSFGQKNESKIENILMNCLINSYHAQGVDIEIELSKLEKHLIENGDLKSTSGQAFYDFYKKVISSNDIRTTLDYDKFEAIYMLNPNEYYSNDCLRELTKLDSSEVATSKFYLLNQKIQEVSQQGNITPSKISEAILSVLSPSDFEKPYYRASGLLAIAWTSNPETEKTELIEPKTIDYSNFPIIAIKASDKNEIIVNGELVNENKFETELAAFIRKNQSRHLIEFSSDKETSYGFYIKVQNAILEIYSSLRDEKAKEIFNKSYSNLTVDEQKKINEIYPTRIKE